MGRGFFIWASTALLAYTLLLPTTATASADFEMQLPQVFLEGITYDLMVNSPSPNLTDNSQPTPLLRVDDFPYTPSPSNGDWIFRDVAVTGAGPAVITLELTGEFMQRAEVPVIPAWVSILPPLVAIGIALLIRSVLPALMLGLWLGAWALEGPSAEVRAWSRDEPWDEA